MGRCPHDGLDDSGGLQAQRAERADAALLRGVGLVGPVNRDTSSGHRRYHDADLDVLRALARLRALHERRLAETTPPGAMRRPPAATGPVRMLT